MILRIPRRKYKSGQRFHVLLISDLHIGSADTDKDLIVSDLDWAKENSADILINGDLCDCIVPHDSKRFVPSMLDPTSCRS